MNNKFWRLKQLNGFDNIVITDEKGVIILYDCADLRVLRFLEMHPDKIVGYKVTALYNNLTEENSTIMRVIKTGEPISNNKQDLETKSGKYITSLNSTYPIIENGKPIGAIEFSKFSYTKEDIRILNNYDNNKSCKKNNTIYTIEDIITENSRMIDIKNKISRIAKTNSSVLIYGKTGTGKEVVAQSIHNLSDRCGKPFISQNCGAIPATLLESILFGTVKGSFTGSHDTKGLFEQADGGTLFLDEINSLDINLQVKLLKAIEEKSIRRIGDNKNIPLDIRIISATNEPPEEIISEGRLRDDLFYRLSVVEINLPNLSERKEDIRRLVEFYMNLYNSKLNVEVNDVEPEVWDCFYKYDWPGNIRELKNAIETAYNNVVSTQITINDIPERIRNFNKFKSKDSEFNGLKSGEVRSLKHSVEEYEKQIIVNELINTEHNISEAARRLGVSKQLLKYKIDKYRLNK